MAREKVSSGHRKHRTVNWLVPVSALMVLYAKIKAARCPDKRAKKKNDGTGEAFNDGVAEKERLKGESEFEFGDGGVWQRSILMGDKCDPLNFSGVIYYDDKGRKINEFPPRSPRLSPFPTYHSQARA